MRISHSKEFLSNFANITAGLLTSAVIIISLLVLAGWQWDILYLKSVMPGFVSMKANTAICFLMAGLSLSLLKIKKCPSAFKFVARAMGLLVLLIGFMTLMEYLRGWNFSIDEIFYRDSLNAVATSSPGRMSPATALNFIFIGLSLLSLDIKSPLGNWIPHILVQPAVIISIMALLGYFYKIQSLYAIATYTQMAIHTAFTFVFLIGAILLSTPFGMPTEVILSEKSDGFMARRLLPVAVMIPFFLGGICLLGSRKGYYDADFAISLLVLLSMVIFTGMVYWNARALRRLDSERDRTEEFKIGFQRIRSIIDTSHDAFVGMDGKGYVINWNRQAEVIFGWERDQALGRPLADLIIPQQYREAHKKGLEKYLATGNGPILNRRIELTAVHRNGREFPVELAVSPLSMGKTVIFNAFLHDISDRKKAEKERESLIQELKMALEKIETLHGLLPICSWCKKIRDEKGEWNQMESYIQGRSKAQFSHGLCPECAEKNFKSF